MFKDYPYHEHTPGLKEYFLVTMGYHFGDLISHFLHTKRNDFFEMGLHHMVTIYLFGGSYLFNFEKYGAVIAYLHDIADILTSITRCLSNSKDKIFIGPIFVFKMFVWFWTRNVVFTILTYYAMWFHFY